MDADKLAKLRSRGLIEPGPSGEECVRVSVHRPGTRTPSSRDALKAEMANWLERLRPQVGEVGGHLIPDTLSVAAQMVEALIPVDCLDDAAALLSKSGLRMDMVETRKIV